MSKKIFFIIIFFISCAISIGTGIFLAEKKLAQEAKNKTINIQSYQKDEVKIDEIKINSEDLNEAEIVEEKNNESITQVENIQEEAGFSFAILGDTQSFDPGSRGGYQLAVDNIKKMNPNMVFSVGDMVSSCDKKAECEKKLNDWKNVLGSLSPKTYVVQGNHDRTGEEKADSAWENVFGYLPDNGPEGFSNFAYSFDFENSHFVVLASDKPEENNINAKQLDWLENDLARNDRENNFVFFHEIAYPTNSKIGESLDKNPKNRDRLWSILTKYKVNAVFSGHEHIQSRRKVGALYQFGFGNTDSFNHDAPKSGMTEYFYVGQAFGLAEVRGGNITVKTYSVQGELLNSFIIPN